jgi:two-component system, NarL family, nitrate/nitrite response regulator NarL
MSLLAQEDQAVTYIDPFYDSDDPTALLKHIIDNIQDRTERECAPCRSPDQAEEVIFEAMIDGTVYVILRKSAETISHWNLSPRELAIARLVAKGMPNKWIGQTLDISPWTVATHLRRIFGKLNVTSRAAMVARLGEAHKL